jgi:hypothetical protein
MQRRILPMLVVLAMLMTSTVGCLGLIPAREAVEGFREPAELVKVYDKIYVSHTYTTLEIQPYTNKSTFVVDDSVFEISVYFKAAFAFSDMFPQFENNTRYVRATLTDSEGVIQWHVDVSSNSAPVEETLEPTPEFAKGEWVLDVQARGIGEETLGLIHDNFNILLTIKKQCLKYPLEGSCSVE